MTDLKFVLDGWDGYHRSLVMALHPLSREQLEFRVAPGMRSVEEVAWHIADGRVQWFARMGVEEATRLSAEIETRTGATAELVAWLDRTWAMVEGVLTRWRIEDLRESFLQPYGGKTFAVPRQWVIFRILLHDVHHGGQISEMLAAQGVEPLELTLLGGHITEPPLAEGGARGSF